MTQNVTVQDCSRTGNNKWTQKKAAFETQTTKIDQKWICWHKISREEPLQAAWRSSKPRETVLQAAWESFAGSARKFQSSRKTRQQRFNFARRSFTVRAKIWKNCTDWRNFARDKNDFARDKNDFARDQKDVARKCRPVLQTASKSKWLTDYLDRLDRFLGPILVSKQIIRHVEQQASDGKHVWKQWARAKATLRMNNQVT